MRIAQLLLQPAPSGDEPDDLGQYGFIDIPSAGDRITIEREATTQSFTVVWVHHRPVAQLGTGGPLLGLPKAEIMVKLAQGS